MKTTKLFFLGYGLITRPFRVGLLIIISLCSLFLSCSTYKMVTIARNTRPIIKQYPEMRILEYGKGKAYEFKNDNTDKLIINIEGSSWHSVLGYTSDNAFHKSGWWYFLVEEYKNEFTIFIPEKLNFELGNYYFFDINARRQYNLENLIESYSNVINAYLLENNYSKIYLMASSEGACILPRLYKKLEQKDTITGLVSISFGGLSMYEQIKILADSELNVPDLLRSVYQNIDDYMVEINRYPNSIGDFIGFPFSYWKSMINYRPIEDYSEINIPVLFVHGELDINTPVNSTRYIQNYFPHKPFEYLFFADADHHSFRSSLRTINELRNKTRQWINKH